jgi:uncharacterized membrane protein YedE/YeeE
VPDVLTAPWPWYVAGPLLGLFAPLLLWLGNRPFGVSSNLRHLCAAIYPRNLMHFRYDWKQEGSWNLMFVLGIVFGGVIAGVLLRNPDPIAISDATRETLTALGVRDLTGLVPDDLFAFSSLMTMRGVLILLGGGFLVGLGTAYAGGCTSGHGITGVADLQPASFVALAAFFAGGVAGTYVLLPLLLGIGG